MAANVSALFGDVHISGKTPSVMLNTRKGKQYLIEGYCSVDDTYRLHVREYDNDTTPKGDRVFDMELDIEAFDNFLKIIKLIQL
jgi:hypothetical protein